MVEVQGFYTSIIAAYLTPTAFIFNGHPSNLFAASMNRSYEILAAIFVFTPIDLLCQLSPPLLYPRCLPRASPFVHYCAKFALGTSCLVHSHPLYRLSYRGMEYIPVINFSMNTRLFWRFRKFFNFRASLSESNSLLYTSLISLLRFPKLVFELLCCPSLRSRSLVWPI